MVTPGSSPAEPGSLARGLERLSQRALRVAVHRWPAELRDEMAAEWSAELHALTHPSGAHPSGRSGSQARAAWRGFRFAVSLAWSRPPTGTGAGGPGWLLSRAVRSGWRPLLAGLFTPVLWAVVALLAQLGTRLVVGAVQPGGAVSTEIPFVVMAPVAGAVAATLAWLSARRPARRPASGPKGAAGSGRAAGSRLVVGAAAGSGGAVRVASVVALPAAVIVAVEWGLGVLVGGSASGINLVAVAGVGCWAVLVGVAGRGGAALVRRGRRLGAALVGVAGAYLACLAAALVAALPVLASGDYVLDWRRFLLLEPWFVSEAGMPRPAYVSFSAAAVLVPSLLAGGALFATVYLLSARRVA
jgi:hypothetical protein